MLLRITLVILFSVPFLPALSQADTVPPGFREYKVRPGDLLGKIAPREHWNLIQRVNRIDERHLVPGRRILVPQDIELAKTWIPIPQQIGEFVSEREVHVFLDSQYFGAYENGSLVFWGPISSGTGKKDEETPREKFRVVRTKIDKKSKKFDNSPMNFGICLDKDEHYWIHEQALPGRPASRGCIRLLRSDAKRLFEWIKIGDLVTIK